MRDGNILNAVREEAEKVGWAVGHAQGHADGYAEEKQDLARKMLDAGIPLDKIVEITGLPVLRERSVL